MRRTRSATAGRIRTTRAGRLPRGPSEWPTPVPPLRSSRRASLAERLSEERPDPTLEVPDPAADDDGIGDTTDTDGEPIDEAEVGDARAGRLVAPDEGASGDPEHDAAQDMIGEDMGIDGGAASAEEAAVHVIDGDADARDSAG